MNHFHIRWSSGALDWERFGSRAEAEEGARQLMRLGESYTVEEHDEACSRCRDAMSAKRPMGTKLGESGSSAD
jgi:hypothetical protein